MKTFIQSTVAVSAVCLLAAWACKEMTFSPTYSNGSQASVSPGGISDGTAAKLTEQVMEQLPEISSH